MTSPVPDTIPCAAEGCERGRVEVAYCPHPCADQPAYRREDCDVCGGTSEVDADWNEHQAAYLEERERILRNAQAGERRLRDELVDAQASAETWKRRCEELRLAQERTDLHPRIVEAVLHQLRALTKLGTVRVPVITVDRHGRVTREERDLAAIGDDAVLVIESLRAATTTCAAAPGQTIGSEAAA